MKNKGRFYLPSLLVVGLLVISFGSVFATAPSSMNWRTQRLSPVSPGEKVHFYGCISVESAGEPL